MSRYSLIIPVHNAERYLRACLNSVCAQTWTDWEAICVDDGSTDRSGDILDEYAARDVRFHVVHQANAGVAVARNVALDQARGEWLVFVDADDVLAKDALDACQKVTSTGLADAYVFKQILRFDGEASPPTESAGSMQLSPVAETLAARRALLTGSWRFDGYVFIRLLRREIFGALRFPKGIAIMEDTWHLMKSLALSARWALVEGGIYGYRMHADSVSHGLPERVLMQEPQVCLQIMEMAERELHMTRRERAIMVRNQRSFLSCCLHRAFEVLPKSSLREVGAGYLRYLWRYHKLHLLRPLAMRCVLSLIF